MYEYLLLPLALRAHTYTHTREHTHTQTYMSNAYTESHKPGIVRETVLP